MVNKEKQAVQKLSGAVHCRIQGDRAASSVLTLHHHQDFSHEIQVLPLQVEDLFFVLLIANRLGLGSYGSSRVASLHY